MFTIPSLSSLSPSNWIPSSLSSRITHYVIKRALGFCFDLPADWQASNLDTGALVLDDLHLDVNAISGRLPPDLPIILNQGRVSQLVLSLSQPVSWTTSTLSISIRGLELDVTLRPSASAHDDSYTSLSESLSEDSDELVKSMAHTLLLNPEQDPEQQRLRESLDDAAQHLPGAFEQSSPQAPTYPTDEEQTTLLASVIARLLARVAIEVSDLTVVASLPTEYSLETPPKLKLQLGKASTSHESVDRSRDISLQGLSLALCLPQNSTSASSSSSQVEHSPPSESSMTSTEDGSVDDMAMSMAVADLRESQLQSDKSRSKAESSMANIEESVYLSAEEDEGEENSSLPEADEQSHLYQSQAAEKADANVPPAASFEAHRVPRPRSSSSEAQSQHHALPSGAQWQRFFFQGSDSILIRLGFPSSGFTPISIDYSIGHPILLLSATQIDALTLLSSLSGKNAPATTSYSTPATKKSIQSTVSVKSCRAVLWMDPQTCEEHPPPELFWTRAPSNPPSTTKPYLSMRILNLHASTVDMTISANDIHLSEHVPHLGLLPIATFDHALGSEYNCIPLESGGSPSSNPFPSVIAQDWVSLASPTSHLHGSSFPRTWKIPPRPHHRKSSSVTEESSSNNALALRVAWADSVQIEMAPLHLRFDLTLLSRLNSLLCYFGIPHSSGDDALSPSTYVPKKSSSHQKHLSTIKLSSPLIRIEVRPPAKGDQAFPNAQELRSGVLTIDLRSFRAAIHSSKTDFMLSHICGFFLPASGTESCMFLQLSPSANQSPHLSFAQKSIDSSSHIALALPIVLSDLHKEILDGLSLFADELSQVQLSGNNATLQSSDAGALLGSRYFGSRSILKSPWDRQQDDTTPSEEESASSTDGEIRPTFELAGWIGKAFVNAHFERRDINSNGLRLLRLTTSELDFFAQGKVHHKNEVQLAFGCKDLDVSEGGASSLLCATLPVEKGSDALLRLKISSITDLATSKKESRVDLLSKMITVNYDPDLRWLQDLEAFVKPPKGVFETAVPAEKTRLKLKLDHISLCVSPGGGSTERALLTLEELQYTANFIPEYPSTLTRGQIEGLKVWVADSQKHSTNAAPMRGATCEDRWAAIGYVDLIELPRCPFTLKLGNGSILPDCDLTLISPAITLKPCADSLATLKNVISGAAAIVLNTRSLPSVPVNKAEEVDSGNPVISILEHIDEAVFHRAAPLESPIDIVSDDVPADPTFLGEETLSGPFATITKQVPQQGQTVPQIVLEDGHQRVHILDASAFDIQQDYLTPERHAEELAAQAEACVTRVSVTNASMSLQLFDGFDWENTVQAVREEGRIIRRRLQKVRQFVANGQTGTEAQSLQSDEDAELLAQIETELSRETGGAAQEDLIKALDAEIQAQTDTDEWESVPAASSPLLGSPKAAVPPKPTFQTSLKRPKECSLELQLKGLDLEFSTFPATNTTAILLNLKADSVSVIDGIKSSTWRMFLTELRVQDGGFARPTDSPMLRFQFAQDRSSTDRRSVESRLKARLTPLRLHVDQDAVDFLKKFFSFQPVGENETPRHSDLELADEAFIKSAVLYPIKIKLDYKPKRVDYKALREGRTAELMNFFHFEGSEMTLRHITLSGVTGWDRFGSMLQDIWTPDVKANQLADVVSGIAPIRSVVNVGSGLADLVLLPLDSYRRDKRVVRGLQKGLASFSKTTALESLRLGARLATGTQVVLEKAEAILGGRLDQNITAEALTEESTEFSPLSRYASQPETLQEGVKGAYRSMRSNLRTTAQTILAVPMEVYERSGNEGPARAVLRAVPIAVLQPAIGATDAMSKALFGLSNQLDPTYDLRHDKYKQ